MKSHIVSILFLISAVECSGGRRFFISAPRIFHVGVKEKVFVQMGEGYLNQAVFLYLEHEGTNTLMSGKAETLCTEEGEPKTVELMVTREDWSVLLSKAKMKRPYLNLVAEIPSVVRKITRVLVSQHRGYIFIQTDQPVYNPTQKVNYRVFTLDHTMRPHEESFRLSVLNADGNKIMETTRTAKGGIFKYTFPIPSVSKMGTWKIQAHYEGDKENAAIREFKVQKFVLPSFEVNIGLEQRYILLDAEHLNFTISAMYTYGEKVTGAYHCQFGVAEKNTQKPVFIKGMELTGSIQDGMASVSTQLETINSKLQEQLNLTLSGMQGNGAQLYLGVFVTNIQSGEVQEADVYLSVLSHEYTMDLSRTRSHFVPGYPLDVVALMRRADGSPAAGVQVKVDVPSERGSWKGATDDDGAVYPTFNIQTRSAITVTVSANGQERSKTIEPASSPTNSYLYMTFTNKVYSVNDVFTITYNTINAPSTGYIYYMVLSRGIIIKKGSFKLGTLVQQKLQITPDMVPAFRLIGYYHRGGDIIADSVWVDVRDECEIKVEVKQKGPFLPGKHSRLEFNLHGEKAKVALLAVDKAFYALNADNKLKAKQVFSAMKSYDPGCTYGGGSDSKSVLLDAGLSFVSQDKTEAKLEFGCNPARQRRSVDLQQKLVTLKSNFIDPELQSCCANGFSLIPMRRTCQERKRRVLLVKNNNTCAEAFLKCCLEAERLRNRQRLTEGLGRTAALDEIEEFLLDITEQTFRRHFPPSFEFREFDVTTRGEKIYNLALPDSITTWEVQIVTLSEASGFCVVKPIEVRAFKETFVSLRLPQSVRKFEQLSISPVIYNYGEEPLELAVHMGQTAGLCSPGSATSTSFVNITLEPHSSQFVSFSAVPMVSGSIPIKIRVFDLENIVGIDAIEKSLNVQPEGLEQREEQTQVFKLDGRSTKNTTIDGTLPDNTVPESGTNIFVSVEGDGFGNSYVRELLSPKRVAELIVLPTGCLEQTMVRLAPTVLALRYLDLSDQWFELPAGTRDDALGKIERGYMRILMYKKKATGSYGAWGSVPSSNWVTALVVKVLSLVAQRQTAAFAMQGRKPKIVPTAEISHPVSYLLSVQKTDGSFSDPHPVLHRGILGRKDEDAAMTAFITVALNRSLQFLPPEMQSQVEASISRSTTYLLSHLEQLQHPYAVALTAYCLSACMPKGTDHTRTWTKLQAMAATGENGCYLWTTNNSPENYKRADGITVETTAYALLTAVELGHTHWADKTACWLTTQENYFGGYKSSQDTIMALEALSEYELKKPETPETNVIAEFSVPGRSDIVTLTLANKKEKVEKNLQKFAGNQINVELRGQGDTKFKTVKAYYILEPQDDCAELSISVTVEGKVKYTAQILENYEYYDYDTDDEKQARVTRSAIEWFDARTRNRRALDNSPNTEDVTYTVCVSLKSNLTGMAIADITLLSGFDVMTEDLDVLKNVPEQYIAHYEVTRGRVLIYFNELYEKDECISFDARQSVPIGLLQPAQALFYDYYEPSRKCTVFYSAPRRSKMVSKLCSEDVCQCAERPCHKLQQTFKRNRMITMADRMLHACFSPVVDYAYIVEVISVSVKSNFELYKTRVTEVLRSHGDLHVTDNSVRVFAKRLQCKGDLEVGTSYLIMGKDGATTDSDKQMQYLLESNTWVEKKPTEQDCRKSAHTKPCKGFNDFTAEYKLDGCRQ